MCTSRQHLNFLRRQSQIYPNNRKQKPGPNSEHYMKETRKIHAWPKKLQASVHQTAALLILQNISFEAETTQDLER